MTITIGRVGQSQSGITLRDPERWTWRGNVLTLSGLASASTYADSVHLRQQLVGLDNNPDEPFVAVTWTVESAIDGFYRVLSVDAPSELSSYVNFHWPYTVTLERVESLRTAIGFESSLVGALVTNGHSVTTAQPFHAVPDGFDHYPGDTSAMGGQATRATDTGTVTTAFASVAAAGPWNLNARWSCEAADYYDGACVIESTVGGNRRAIVGRNDKQTALRLNNGIVRFTPLTTLEIYNGSSWETLDLTFTIYPDGPAGASALGASNFAQILRNSPEEVVVRYTLPPLAPDVLEVVTIDFSLRRGASYVTGFLQSTKGYRFGLLGAAATSSTTGTMFRSSNDSNGNRWFVCWDKAATITAVTGVNRFILNATQTSAMFAFGGILDYSTAVAPYNLAVQTSSFFAPLNERTRVVRR
jgi:hypothetical protein